jgi:Spy/CpxP family protein refolding chaperone
MKAIKAIRHLFIIGTAIFCFTSLAIGQAMEGLQMKELTEKLQLNEQQQKALTPIVAQRDKAVKALMGNTSMGKLQKLRKVQEIQTNFRAQAGKVLTPEQTKKLEALQAERREKLLGS